jgi:hypothetical protein
VDKHGRKHVRKLTVLAALQQHIVLAATNGSTTVMDTEFGQPIDVADGAYEDATSIAKDLTDLSDPTRSAVGTERLTNKVEYTNEDVLTVNEERFAQIKSPYIRERVRAADGLSVLDAKALRVPNATGTIVRYMASDLKYDINLGRFHIESSSVITKAMGVLHPESLLKPKSQHGQKRASTTARRGRLRCVPGQIH